MPVHHELSEFELVVLLIELGSRKQLFLRRESLCMAGMLVSHKASCEDHEITSSISRRALYGSLDRFLRLKTRSHSGSLIFELPALKRGRTRSAA